MERGGGGGLTSITGRSMSQSGGGAPSPMMDAPFSPGLAPHNGILGFGMGPGGEGGRVKIGQTSLHNPGGTHSWVGL